jgi:hypothetical protein
VGFAALMALQRGRGCAIVAAWLAENRPLSRLTASYSVRKSVRIISFPTGAVSCKRNTVKPAADFLQNRKTSELWRDPELTLATLALGMEMTSAQISRLLNVGLNRNFNETINRLRVE